MLALSKNHSSWDLVPKLSEAKRGNGIFSRSYVAYGMKLLKRDYVPKSLILKREAVQGQYWQLSLREDYAFIAFAGGHMQLLIYLFHWATKRNKWDSAIITDTECEGGVVALILANWCFC